MSPILCQLMTRRAALGSPADLTVCPACSAALMAALRPQAGALSPGPGGQGPPGQGIRLHQGEVDDCALKETHG